MRGEKCDEWSEGGRSVGKEVSEGERQYNKGS